MSGGKQAICILGKYGMACPGWMNTVPEKIVARLFASEGGNLRCNAGIHGILQPEALRIGDDLSDNLECVQPREMNIRQGILQRIE